MTDAQYQLFIAAFFVDKEKLSQLIQSVTELNLTIQNKTLGKSSPIGCSMLPVIKISVPEIISMTIDVFSSYKHLSCLANYKQINPIFYYENALACNHILGANFPKFKIVEVPYQNYLNLMYTFNSDDEYFDAEEIETYSRPDMQRIDFDLVNAAYHNNMVKVSDLLAKGANPYVDFYKEGISSTILAHLEQEKSLGMDYYFEYLDQYQEIGELAFNNQQAFNLIEALYKTASTTRMYNLILSNCKGIDIKR